MKKKNFKNAELFLLNILKPKLKNNISFFRLTVRNGHPFIYYTPYYSKTESVSLDFFNNGKIRIYTISMFEYIINEDFIYNSYGINHKKIIKNIKEIVKNRIRFSSKDHFPEFINKNSISNLKKEIRVIIRKNLIKFFINEILYKKTISNLYVNGSSYVGFHFKNYYTEDYGVVVISDSYIKLIKKEESVRKELYFIDINKYILNDNLQVSFLEKELKELKKKINVYF